jgi:hypothetical protein
MRKTLAPTCLTAGEDFSVFEYLLVDFASTSLQPETHAEIQKQTHSNPLRRR